RRRRLEGRRQAATLRDAPFGRSSGWGLEKTGVKETAMYNFTFHRPTGLRQASNMLGKLEEPKILAGGQTLIPTMKLRLSSPGNIVAPHAIEGELSRSA